MVHRHAHLIATCFRMDKHQKTKLLKSQTEDAKQLCSILRMRGFMFSLNERPLDAGSQCLKKGVARWPGSALRRVHSLFLLLFGFLRGGRWKVAFTWEFFPETHTEELNTGDITISSSVNSAEHRVQAPLCAHCLVFIDRVSAPRLTDEGSKPQ